MVYLVNFGVEVTCNMKSGLWAVTNIEQLHVILVREAARLIQAEVGKLLQLASLSDAACMREKSSSLFSGFNNKIHCGSIKKLVIRSWICFPFTWGQITDLLEQMCMCVCVYMQWRDQIPHLLVSHPYWFCLWFLWGSNSKSDKKWIKFHCLGSRWLWRLYNYALSLFVY